MIETTLSQLRQLKLNGMASALQTQLEQPGTYEGLAFAERLQLLVDHEDQARHQRKQEHQSNRIRSDQLIIELSQLFTKATGKPERYVMMAQTGGKTPCFMSAAISRWLNPDSLSNRRLLLELSASVQLTKGIIFVR
jgi:hypothetical protein